MTYRDSPRRATRDANVTQCIRAQDLVHARGELHLKTAANRRTRGPLP